MIAVYSNDPVTPMVGLGVRADLEVVLIPDPVTIDVGKLGWHERTVRELRLSGPEAAGVRALSAEFVREGREIYPATPSIELRDAKPAPDVSPAPGAYDLVIGSGAEPGRFLGTLVIATDHPRATSLHVRLSGEILPPIVHQPSRLVLTNLEPDVQVQYVIRLDTTGDGRIDGIEAMVDHPALRTEVRRNGDAWEVLLTCDGRFEGETASAEVRIVTGHPVVPRIVVPVTLMR